MNSDADFTNDFLHSDQANASPSEPASLEINSLADAMELLDEIVLVGDDDGQDPAIEFGQLLRRLSIIIENGNWGSDEDQEQDSADMIRAVIDGVRVIGEAFSQQPDALDDLVQRREDLISRYGDQLVDEELSNADWAAEIPASESCLAETDLDQPSAEEIGMLLSELRSAEPPEEESPVAADQGSGAETTDDYELVDDELRIAFLDDADRCLAAMETALLSLESNLADPNPLTALGRELHTLKGASGSIGLNALAEYIHSVEDSIRDIETSKQLPAMEPLLQQVDTIRGKVDQFRGAGSTQAAAVGQIEPTAQQSNNATGPPPAPEAINFEDNSADDESVRIKSSKLNRLMDMLSELVMLRNQRDTELSRLIAIHEDLIESVGRLRVLNQDHESLRPMAALDAQEDLLAPEDSSAPENAGKILNEIANEILESAQHLRHCYQPVADGNNQVSQFIRSFRQELVELRRTPIAGLFLRLRRAVSDAARSEGKQVQLALSGEQTGIERSLQGKLFEPLLHIVRNSVSHGIESPEQRVAGGKAEQGTITLRADSGPDLLVIEVRDDGRGLDFDAIRRRGLERGLITPDVACENELAQLIFHPGFSTRQTTSQIAGRGVGMDVVASTLQRMRGWVDVDSVPGTGTRIRLSVPLPSMIQHVMIFRAAGQLFAVPMQAVQSAGEPDANLLPISICQLLGTADDSPAMQRDMLVLGNQSSAADKETFQPRRTAILVDQIIGPEEVVVRPLPWLFKHHPVCSGATLSGSGEVVLLLDANRLAQPVAGFGSGRRPQQTSSPKRQAKVLVVDDSASARTRAIRSLSRYDVQIVQSTDGSEAWNEFQAESFDAVFSDIDMPQMTGLELLANIKQHADRRRTPVVLVSSRNEKSIHEQAAQLGAVACLPKPLTDQALDGVLSAMPLTLSLTH